MDSRRRGNSEVGGRTDEMGCVYAGGWRQAAALRGSPTPGLRPRIGVRGMLLIAGVTSWEYVFVAIADAGCRRHAKGMKIGCIGWWESSSVIATTRTSPLDSRLRGNDEMSGGSLSRIGVRDMLS